MAREKQINQQEETTTSRRDFVKRAIGYGVGGPILASMPVLLPIQGKPKTKIVDLSGTWDTAKVEGWLWSITKNGKRLCGVDFNGKYHRFKEEEK